jgi:hypothetical protein
MVESMRDRTNRLADPIPPSGGDAVEAVRREAVDHAIEAFEISENFDP